LSHQAEIGRRQEVKNITFFDGDFSGIAAAEAGQAS